MGSTLDTVEFDTPKDRLAEQALRGNSGRVASMRVARPEVATCFHCGEPCPDATFCRAEKVFCCQGCQVVHDLLAENGLEQFYHLSRHPGVQIRSAAKREEWSYVDEPALQQQLLDFTDGKVSRVTFHIPAIHCVACVWLLENLFRLHEGIGKTQVNFPKRELALSFQPDKIPLSGVIALLASVGYQPQLTLGALDKKQTDPARKRNWLQIGIAGFAFGNIMLFSLPGYLGLDSLSGALFQAVFGYISLALALPVLIYSAGDYWRLALVALRQRTLTLDVPIALGLAALYAQSAFELISGRGAGYLDSLSGLVFFLLCGRAFQQKTQERIAFDRDYKCFFPLSVLRKTSSGEESLAIANVRVGDRLRLRNGELIPADGRLVQGEAFIDYSFVTGESEPVVRVAGDYLYAGGKQVGSIIEVETVKPVSQSYLTSLWNHETFHKERQNSLDTMTNRYSRRFTLIVICVAIAAALCWWLAGQPARGLKAFTSVLIVACPCALALAAPFALGTAQRLLARIEVFIKNTLVLERLARVNTIVFDKTGTLTTAAASQVKFVAPLADTSNSGAEPQPPSAKADHDAAPASRPRVRDTARAPAGAMPALCDAEAAWVGALTRHSTHPHSLLIHRALGGNGAAFPVHSFVETAGSGIQGRAEGHFIQLGARAWLEGAGIPLPRLELPVGSAAYLAIDGAFRGAFVLSHCLPPDTEQLLRELGKRYELALLSGDNEKDRERFSSVFARPEQLHFNQSPFDKLAFIRGLQNAGRTVLMAGDGLNDAGALKQSDVGIAVVEQIGAFSPASDVILEARQVPRLLKIISLSRKTARIVRLSFGISAIYNLVGISVAAAGILSPIICAVLMPLSSISVVLFACGATRWAARQEGLI